MKSLRTLVLLLASALPALPASASTLGSAADFINIGLGARETAMGKTGAALSRGVYAPSWNIAGLGAIKTLEFSATEMLYVDGINFGALGYGQKLGQNNAVGFQLTLLNDSQVTRDASGNDIGSIQSSIYSLSGGLSHRFVDGLWGGVQFRGVREQFGSVTKELSEIDAGLIYDLDEKPISLGFTTRDIMVSGFQEYTLGAVYRAMGGLLNFSVDGIFPDSVVRAGAEYVIKQNGHRLALRAGFMQDAFINDLGGMTAGVGVKTAPMSGILYGLDYSYVPFGFFGAVHQFSVTFEFAALKPTKVSKNLRYELVDDGRVLVLWDAPGAGAPLGYNLYRIDSDEPNGRVKLNKDLLAKREQVLKNAKLKKRYVLAVAAVYQDGEAEMSPSIDLPPNVVKNVEKELAIDQPIGATTAAVNGLRYESVGDGRIVLLWEAPGDGQATPVGYNLYRLDPQEANGRLQLNVRPILKTQQLIKNAKREKKYLLAVTAIYADGESELSNSVEIPPSTP